MNKYKIQIIIVERGGIMVKTKYGNAKKNRIKGADYYEKSK